METGIRIITCAIVFGLAALSANADISTDVLSLVVQPDGSAEIVNGTSAAIQFDGYEITSAQGNLDPAGWYSISDAYSYAIQETSSGDSGPIQELTYTLGRIPNFAEANPSATHLAEITAGDGATLQPGASWSIGQPFAAMTDESIGWSYSITGDDVVVGQRSYLIYGMTTWSTGDIDGDGDTDLADWQTFKGSTRDLDGDGDVDLNDMTIIRDNYTGAATIFLGDADMDDDVDLADFITLKANFETGTLWSEGNFDGDAVTDLDDFILLKNNFTGASPVPEPATLVLVLAGCLITRGRR